MIETLDRHQCKAHVENGLVWISVHIDCKYLTPEGCTIYEDRPEVCRLAGEDGKYVLDNCLWKDLEGSRQLSMEGFGGVTK
jgi:Fe-S-cluster containining protein